MKNYFEMVWKYKKSLLEYVQYGRGIFSRPYCNFVGFSYKFKTNNLLIIERQIMIENKYFNIGYKIGWIVGALSVSLSFIIINYIFK